MEYVTLNFRLIQYSTSSKVSVLPTRKFFTVLNPTFSTLLFQPYFSTMPRRALAPISGNIPRRKELTRYERGVVVGFAGGVKASQIATELSLPKSTVQETLSKAP